MTSDQKLLRVLRTSVHPRLLVAAIVALVLMISTHAQAQIKQPGAHPDYSVELDPHLVLAFDGPFDSYYGSEGFGVGFRATIPIVKDGPIKTINNSMGIGFGGDWMYYGDSHCNYWHWKGYDCHGSAFYFPVVLQWNFWLTPKISVFGEPGLTIRHASVHREYPCGGDVCSDDYSHTSFIPIVLWGGGRFLVSDSIGITVRLGWPYLAVGVGFLI